MTTDESATVLLRKFVDGLTKAAGATSCLVQDHQDVRFIPLRDKLMTIRDKAIDIAIKASGIKVERVSRH